MFKKTAIIGIFTLLFFCSAESVFAKTYNPKVQTWIKEIDATLALLKSTPADPDEKIEECKKSEWSSFAKSFLSYDNFTSDWKDIINRNDCLRVDLWTLEDKLHEINKFGVLEAKKCNDDLSEIQALYSVMSQHIDGLRRYGEDGELETTESVNCPNCKKAEIVGAENVYLKYESKIYTDAGCELTREKSKTWKEEFAKLKESMNLFKNIKKLWEDGISDQSFDFTSEDYAAAKGAADGWWDKSWNSFYSFNGRQLSFRHLRDGEDSLLGGTRIGELAKSAKQAVSEVLFPPTVEELVDEYALQLDVFQAISVNKEQVEIDQDLAKWKSQLDLKYKVSSNATDDLENYLINLNNSIKILIDKNNPIILNYYKKLKYTAENHCRNLYGACKE